MRGARQSKICEIMGISARTLQHWKAPENETDNRLNSKCTPSNKLSELERQQIIRTCNLPEYASLSPSKIVPTLADKGIY